MKHSLLLLVALGVLSFPRLGYSGEGDNPPAIGVEIVEVLDVYYADSPSWMPYRFRITGTSQNVTITQGTVEFYLNGDPQFGCDISKPIGTDETYIFKPTNGQGYEYLAVIDQAEFDAETVSTGGEKVTATLKLTGVSGTVGGIAFGPINSTHSDAFSFGDKRIEILEFGTNEEFLYTKSTTRQNTADFSDTRQYRILGRDTGTGGPYPFDITINQVLNYDFDAARCGVTPNAVGYKQESYLEDDLDLTGVAAGYSCEIRSFNKQLGVCWIAYYNQVSDSAPGNPFGEIVVGTVDHHTGATHLFQNGTAASAITEGGVLAEDITRAFGYTTTAVGVAAFVVSGPWGLALEGAGLVVSALADLSDAVALNNDNPDVAEVVVTKVSQSNNDDPVPVNILREHSAGSEEYDLNISEQYATMYVDNYFRVYLTTTTNVRIQSRYLESKWVDVILNAELGDKKFKVQWQSFSDTNIACDSDS